MTLLIVQQHTDTALSVHRHAWKLYEAKPVQARVLVLLRQQTLREGYTDDWHGLALGDSVEYPSEQWSHIGFSDHAENLQQMADNLRNELAFNTVTLA